MTSFISSSTLAAANGEEPIYADVYIYTHMVSQNYVNTNGFFFYNLSVYIILTNPVCHIVWLGRIITNKTGRRWNFLECLGLSDCKRVRNLGINMVTYSYTLMHTHNYTKT